MSGGNQPGDGIEEIGSGYVRRGEHDVTDAFSRILTNQRERAREHAVPHAMRDDVDAASLARVGDVIQEIAQRRLGILRIRVV